MIMNGKAPWPYSPLMLFVLLHMYTLSFSVQNNLHVLCYVSVSNAHKFHSIKYMAITVKMHLELRFWTMYMTSFKDDLLWPISQCHNCSLVALKLDWCPNPTSPPFSKVNSSPLAIKGILVAGEPHKRIVQESNEWILVISVDLAIFMETANLMKGLPQLN